MMQIRRDDLPLAGRAWAVRSCESGRASLAVPRHETVLGRATDRQGPNTVDVAVAIAVVMIATTISGRPYENRALAVATLKMQALIDKLDLTMFLETLKRVVLWIFRKIISQLAWVKLAELRLLNLTGVSNASSVKLKWIWAYRFLDTLDVVGSFFTGTWL